MIIVNGFQPLTIITKHSILDVAATRDPPLKIELQAAYCCFITGYYTQTYLPNINEELRRLDDAINNKLIPSFTGKLCGNDERLLLSLPTKSALRLSVRIRSYSGPHFPHSNWTRTRITPNWDTFYAVPV